MVPARGGILRQHLADDEAFVAAPVDRLGDDPLGDPIAIHLGRVDQRQPKIEAELQRIDLGLAFARTLAHVPSALAELRHVLARGQCHRGQIQH